MILNLKGDNMPPKNKFTRNEIISCALGIAEEGGLEAVTARAVASCLEASSKVIFGCFESMNELQNEVVAAAYQKYLDEQARLCESGEYPVYKASVMAYICFARSYPKLFKILFMQISPPDEPGKLEEMNRFTDIVSKNVGIAKDDAYMFHLEMWVYVHGIATMIATGYLNWEQETVSRMLTDAYMGLKERYAKLYEPKGSE